MLRRSTLAAAGAALTLPFVARAGAQTMATSQPRMMALMSGAFAMASSEIAQNNSSSALVKQFATFEIAEQQGVMRAVQLAGMEVPNPPQTTEEHARQLQQLGSLRGMEFDRMYLQGQVAGHQELYQAMSTILGGGGGREEQIIAAVALPTIQQHLTELRAIQAQMRG